MPSPCTLFRAVVASLAPAILASQTPRADSVRADSAARLAPIVVRALRAATSGEAAPWAVTVRERDAIDRSRAGLALDEPLRGIPGVQVDNRNNWALGERISMRGFGARAQFGVRGIMVLVDGVPATLPDGQTTLSHVDVALVQRAEVVRGPASSLYGNAAGGVLLLETTPPPLAGAEAQAGAVAGAYGLRRAHASVGGRAGTLGWLLHGSRLDATGYRSHARAENEWLLGKLSYELGPARAAVVLTRVRYDARNPGSLSDSLLRLDRRRAFAGNVLQNTGEIGRQTQLGGTVGITLRGMEVEVVPWILTRHLDNPIPQRIIDLSREASGVRVQVRSPEREHRAAWWAAGVEHGLQHDDRLNFLNSAGTRGEKRLDQDERVTVRGAFAQVGAAVHDRLRLDGGIRADRANFRVRDRLVTARDPDDSGEREMSAVSPSMGASLRVSDRGWVYANAATAFETPTTTELANRPTGAGGFNADLQPQRSRSVELGAKGVLRRTLRFESAVYAARVRDALIAFEVAGTPGRQFFRNAGRVSYRGAELGVRWSPSTVTRVEAAYALTDARFREYRVGTTSFDGKRLPGVSPHRADLAVTRTGAGGLFASVEGRAASRLPVNDANDHWSGPYVTADLRAGVAERSIGFGRITVYGGVANVLDRRYNSSVVINAFGRRYYEPAPERSLFVGGRVSGAIAPPR